MLDNSLALLTWLIPAVLGGVAFVFLLSRWLVNVGPTQIAITERRYLGKKLRAGRAFATDGEVGIQAQYLTPGLHFVAWPFVTVIKKADFVVIGSDELGIVTAVDGDEMPAGRVFAEDKAGEHHDNFQNPVAFLGQGGVRGKQLRFLTNGTFKIHPLLFSVKKIKKTVIPEGKIGVITAADGAALRDGQLLGMRVPEHDNFQKAEIFLQKGGQKGPQIDFLRPGTYNIFDEMFQVEQRDAIYVREDQVGIVDAKDGEPMGKDDVVAATPEMGQHNSYQDGQAFLSKNGKRGPQESVLRPGVYYINPYLFNVTMRPLTVIKQGECGVLISNIGKDPSKLNEEETQPGSAPVSGSATDPEESRLDAGVRGRHVVPNGYRGIQKNVLMPGKYNINPLAYTVIPIPTTTRSVEWSENKGAQDFDPFSVVSNDGFEMKVEVRCQYRILPENAPYVVQKLGSIEELERNVIHPQIDGMFRAQVSKSPAIKYQQERAKEQTEAEEAVRSDLTRYKVEIVSVMICNIKLPQELMHTTQERNLAEQRKAMFDSQREAEVRRIELEKTKSQADQQKAMMEAQTGIEISKSKALQAQEAARGEAEAIKLRAAAEAEATKLRAAADAEKTTKTGLAQAEVIQKQGEAQAEAYRKQAEALTPEGLAAIELARKFTEAKTVLTPEILIQSGGGGGNGGVSPMIELLLAQQLRNGLSKTAEKDKGSSEEPKDAQK